MHLLAYALKHVCTHADARLPVHDVHSATFMHARSAAFMHVCNAALIQNKEQILPNTEKFAFARPKYFAGPKCRIRVLTFAGPKYTSGAVPKWPYFGSHSVQLLKN